MAAINETRPRGPIAKSACQYTAGSQKARIFDALLAAHASYRDAGVLPATLRQFYYKGIGLGLLEKGHNVYNASILVAGDMRLAGIIPWWDIRDEVTAVHPADPKFADVDEFKRRYTPNPNRYSRRLLNDQPKYFEVFTESGGMAQQLAEVAADYGITVTGAKGFDKTPAKMAFVRRMRRETARRPAVILTFGDGDVWGHHIEDARQEWIEGWWRAEYYGECEPVRKHTGPYDWRDYFTDPEDDVDAWAHPIEWERVAVLPEHIARYNLPIRPEDEDKPSEEQKIECEALPPAVLNDLLRKAIEDPDHWDKDAATATRARIQRDRAKLRVWNKEHGF